MISLNLSSRRRATTLVEGLISLSIFGLVAGFVVFVSVAVARSSRESLEHLPRAEQAQRSLFLIHKRLATATAASISISSDNKQITFRNVVRFAPSSFFFDATRGVCVMDEDQTVEGDEITWGRGLHGTFHQEAPNLIRVRITFGGFDRNRQPVNYEYEDLVALRN